MVLLNMTAFNHSVDMYRPLTMAELWGKHWEGIEDSMISTADMVPVLMHYFYIRKKTLKQVIQTNVTFECLIGIVKESYRVL